MMDLISRQAAIDAAIEAVDEWDGGYNLTRADMIADAINNNVPSAQPEIIRCKDCEFGEQDEVGRWFCRSLGCQIGNEDGSGFCADAERRTNNANIDT